MRVHNTNTLLAYYMGSGRALCHLYVILLIKQYGALTSSYLFIFSYGTLFRM